MSLGGVCLFHNSILRFILLLIVFYAKIDAKIKQKGRPASFYAKEKTYLNPDVTIHNLNNLKSF
jgi:hypothetical protein